MNRTTGVAGDRMALPSQGRGIGGVIAILGLSLLAGCGGESEGGPGQGGPMAMGGLAERAIPVAVEVVGAGDLRVLLRGSTNLRARSQVEVLPKQGGITSRILVEEGDVVREGQPLAVLDAQEWTLQARQSRARAQSAQDALERGIALQERGLLADQEVETLRSNAEVASADAALAELRVENATIVSPMAGVVTHRNIEQGQLVGTNTAAFTVADISRLEADVGVPEREATRVQIGQPVQISAEGIGPTITGHVSRVRPVVDPGSGTVQVTVDVDSQQGGGLRAGQFVNVDIVTQVLQDRLVLPRTAILVDGPVPRVFRVVDGLAEELTIQMGGGHGEGVEILGGISPGDTIVIVGQQNLRAGSAVSVMEVNGTPISMVPDEPVLTSQEPNPGIAASTVTDVRPAANEGRPAASPGTGGGSR